MKFRKCWLVLMVIAMSGVMISCGFNDLEDGVIQLSDVQVEADFAGGIILRGKMRNLTGYSLGRLEIIYSIQYGNGTPSQTYLTYSSLNDLFVDGDNLFEENLEREIEMIIEPASDADTVVAIVIDEIECYIDASDTKPTVRAGFPGLSGTFPVDR